MRLKNVKGKLVKKNISKYSIKWDGKSRSNFQFLVKQFLKKHWFGHIVYEEFPVFGTRLKVDILNATKKIAVEAHGGQHTKFNKFFHGTVNGYSNSIMRDSIKINWLESNGFQVIEIYENEINDLSKAFIKDKFDIEI